MSEKSNQPCMIHVRMTRRTLWTPEEPAWRSTTWALMTSRSVVGVTNARKDTMNAVLNSSNAASASLLVFEGPENADSHPDFCCWLVCVSSWMRYSISATTVPAITTGRLFAI